MFSTGKRELPDGSFLVSAAAVWLISACVLLVLASLLASLTEMGEQGLAYLSSAISFLCAAFAGAAAARKRSCPSLLTALITGTALVILLLTVGFLIKGDEMDPSSILSLVSFSFAGVILGATLRSMPHAPEKKCRRR